MENETVIDPFLATAGARAATGPLFVTFVASSRLSRFSVAVASRERAKPDEFSWPFPPRKYRAKSRQVKTA
jgi:hypothetical protein